MGKSNWLPIIAILLIVVGGILLKLDYDDDLKNCDYDSETRNYVGKSPDECSRIQVLCVEERVGFSDECGCGCELIAENQIG